MEQLYKEFIIESKEFLSAELKRIGYSFDERRNYTEGELFSLITSAAGDTFRPGGVIKLKKWTDLTMEILEKKWQSKNPPNQQALNEGYLEILKLISSRKGNPPMFNEQDLDSLLDKIIELDKFCSSYCEQRFTFYKFGGAEILSNKHVSALHSMIDASYLKYEAFFGASIATFTHLLRNVCNVKVGFLSRIILSRSLLESSIHNLFVIRKLHGIASRIESKGIPNSIQELESFRNQFLRGMFGTKSPAISSEAPKPYNILTCFECLKKNPIDYLTHDYMVKFYDHLCDFTHPNYLMRYTLTDVQPARGDYFCDEVIIDTSFEGKLKASHIFECLIDVIKISMLIIEKAFDEKEQTRVMLNTKNLVGKHKFSFNGVTGPPRPKMM